MGRFVVGFFCGAFVTVAIALALGVGASQRPRADNLPTVHREPAADDANRAPRQHVREPSDHGTPDGPAEMTRATAAPQPQGADDDQLALLRAAIATGDADAASRHADAIRTASPQEQVPRDVVIALAAWLPAARDRFRVEAALQHTLATWPGADLERLLREIEAASPGASPLDHAAPFVAWQLGGAHELNDLAAALAGSTDAARRRAAVQLAATSRRPDAALVHAVFEASQEPALRAFAVSHLASMADARAGGDARELAGRAALSIFLDGGSREERRAAIGGLVFGGTEGLDIAEALVRDGGLSTQPESPLMEGLVDAGRALALIRDLSLDVRLRGRVAAALLDAEPRRESEVLAIWPLLPELLSAQGDDLWLCPEEFAAEIGRFDLVENLALDARLAAMDRASALEELFTHEKSDRRRALDLLERLAVDPESSVALRKELVDVVWAAWDTDDARHVGRLVRLLERMARDDANEWVRNDAADAMSFLRTKLPATGDR